MKDVDIRVLSYGEQRDRGIVYPRGDCPVCTVNYRITKDDTMFQHGARNSSCKGTHQRAAGLPETEA